MLIFKTKWFNRWANREDLSDEALHAAITEMKQGLIDADLGGEVYKKRVATPGKGKRGGFRTIIAFRRDDKAFFIYGFAKNQRDNISDKELKALKLLAEELLGYSDHQLKKSLSTSELTEVTHDDP